MAYSLLSGLASAQHGCSGSAAHLDSKSADPVGEQTEAVDHEVHHHGVVGVLGAAQSGFDDGEAGLHEHNQEAATRVQVKVDTDAILSGLIYQIR